MFHFLETDIGEQKKYEMKTQTSADNTVNDLRYEIKFDNCVKEKKKKLLSEKLLFFPEQKYILFLETYFSKTPRNLITSVFLLPRQTLKDIGMPWQKPQMLHW